MYKYLITSLLITFYSSLLFAELNDANKIRSVWNMKSQSCNGVSVNDMYRHKHQESIKSTKLIKLENLGFSFKVPQLPEVKETVIKINIGDKTRGVVDNYILISDQDLEAPFAAIVITELPPSMNSREQVFSAVNTLENQLAMKSGYKVVLTEIDGPHGRSLEMIVKDRIGSYCFPTSGFEFLPKNQNISTTSVSRFSFIGGKLIEFTVVVTNLKDESNIKPIQQAKAVMDGFWSRLKQI